MQCDILISIYEIKHTNTELNKIIIIIPIEFSVTMQYFNKNKNKLRAQIFNAYYYL